MYACGSKQCKVDAVTRANSVVLFCLFAMEDGDLFSHLF